MKIIKNLKLNPYNTFNLNSLAKEVIIIENNNDLEKFLKFIQLSNKSNLIILGRGSNIVLTKTTYDYVFIDRRNSIILKENTIEIDGGVLLNNLIKFLWDQKIVGLENLFGIPGTLAGAVISNVGAYEREIEENILSVEVVDIETRDIFLLKKRDLNFSYRSSIFKKWLKENKKFFITKIFIDLNSLIFLEREDDLKQYKSKAYNILKIRKFKLPRGRHVGSFFKNPPHNFAGKLIEEAGLKGFRYKNLVVSPKHANVIINIGESTGEDVIAIENIIKEEVYKKFSILLEREVIYI